MDGPEREKQRAALAEVREKLIGNGQPIEQVAEAVLSLLVETSAVNPKP